MEPPKVAQKSDPPTDEAHKTEVEVPDQSPKSKDLVEPPHSRSRHFSEFEIDAKFIPLPVDEDVDVARHRAGSLEFSHEEASPNHPSKAHDATKETHAGRKPHTLKERFAEVGLMKRYQEIDQLFRNNVRWYESKTATDPDYFLRLKDIQKPDFLWIGCADSRVPANEIVGLEPGEIFVTRNIGNLVLASDLSMVSVVEFAVSYLKVKHIIVCGHYGCSGVKYAFKCTDAGLLNPWITTIRENYRHNRHKIEAEETEEARIRRFVEYNVIEGCMTLMKMATIQKAFAENRFPVIHACVYDLSNGRLINLNIDFIERMKTYGDIYNFGFEKKHEPANKEHPGVHGVHGGHGTTGAHGTHDTHGTHGTHGTHETHGTHGDHGCHGGLAKHDH